MIQTTELTIETQGNDQMIDLTQQAQQAVDAAGCQAGIVTLFVAHTTAAIAVSEIETGLIDDLPAMLERIAPREGRYRHNIINHDDNAHSHLRTTVIGPSLTVPLVRGRLTLGIWQRVVLIDFDTHPRRRTVIVQVMGE